MGSRSSERPIAELIREIVKAELAKQKISGHGGNTNITSDKDINLTTIGGGKAYYNGTEIGFGVTGGKIWLNAAHTAWMIINANGTLEFHVSGGIQEVPTS